MFNLFKTKQAVTKELAVAEQIEEIHHAFNSEGDRLLAEAKAVLAEKVVDSSKEAIADRLRKVGFGSSPVIDQVNAIKKERALSEETAKRIEHYNFYYPQNRFIDENNVIRLCEKYNLHFGPVGSYVGGVPVNNLTEIENFKVREEDMDYGQRVWGMRSSERYAKTYDDFVRQEHEKELARQDITRGIYSGLGFYQSHHYHKEEIRPNTGLSICAPLKDFKLNDRQKVSGRKIIEIPDPIVLHPVNGGYLIVTAWGLEAKDESVMNSNKN